MNTRLDSSPRAKQPKQARQYVLKLRKLEQGRIYARTYTTTAYHTGKRSYTSFI
ncbi:hypothetical protein [Helicobacter canis]|uniref:hypothetical protein n=1 Tax=Helicobacter canis TaxID=29419 RepID=UPI0014796496|nr:hypothetical protein [Helicobacter canis]